MSEPLTKKPRLEPITKAYAEQQRIKINLHVKELEKSFEKDAENLDTQSICVSLQRIDNQSELAQHRRLDSLARAIVSDKDTCVAICFDGNKLLVANNNSDYENIKIMMVFLQQHVRGINECGSDPTVIEKEIEEKMYQDDNKLDPIGKTNKICDELYKGNKLEPLKEIYVEILKNVISDLHLEEAIKKECIDMFAYGTDFIYDSYEVTDFKMFLQQKGLSFTDKEISIFDELAKQKKFIKDICDFASSLPPEHDPSSEDYYKQKEEYHKQMVEKLKQLELSCNGFISLDMPRDRFYEIASKIIRPSQDAKKVLRDLCANIPDNIGKNIIDAIKDGRVEYVSIQNQEELHAEMKIVQKLLNKESNRCLEDNYYIGVSKLCCCLCHAALQAISGSNIVTTVRGTHGGLYPNWEIPDFLCNETVSSTFIDIIDNYVKAEKFGKGSDVAERSPSPPDVKTTSKSKPTQPSSSHTA